MTKIVYLLGAGASYGERQKDDRGQEEFGAVKRGVPIVSEFSKAIDQVIINIENGHYNNTLANSNELTGKDRVIQELDWLKDRCQNYPTIDTYARMLYVKGEIDTYNRLKKALSVFLLLVQEVNKRDLRYDGFIASLITDNSTLPNNINILSWNYDAQFEFSYAGYLPNESQKIESMWKTLKIYHKGVQIKHNSNSSFSITKLNGTAFQLLLGQSKKIIDPFFDHQGQSLIYLANLILQSTDDKTGLSFAWEMKEDNRNEKTFIQQIQQKLAVTEVLVVIGYSFPYVNREIDRALLTSMFGLKKIYIQDPNAEEIKESLLATLYPNQEVEYKWVLSKNTRQFIIPNELV